MPHPRRSPPTLEPLERRDVPSVARSVDSRGDLLLVSNAASDRVVIDNYKASDGNAWYRITINGDSAHPVWQLASAVRAGAVWFWGYGGNDTFIDNTGKLRDMLHGGDGNDTLQGSSLSDYLYGDNGNDRLSGGGGPDVLQGGSGADVLYGGAGYDWLYGGAGDDFLDAQADGGYYDGGLGLDCNANQSVVGGTGRNDIRQGRANTCWFLAPLGAVASHLNAGRYITYKGQGNYTVYLWNGSRWVSEAVHFEGNATRIAADAVVTANGDVRADKPGCEGEFWVTLMQRGLLQYFHANPASESSAEHVNFGDGAGEGGWPDVGFGLLGFPAAQQIVPGSDPWSSGAHLITDVRAALAGGEGVIASFDGGSSKLVNASHAYEVTAIDKAGNVTLRNPWGIDNSPGRSLSGPNDGYVTLTAAEFGRLCYNVTISSQTIR